ncbi:MAG: tetratricopeptide repeat protein [Bacteroidales bacterium]|nr:tetratricopeptide repeat protein [Bacteroidales bacterium]
MLLISTSVCFSQKSDTDTFFVKLKKAKDYKDSINIYLDIATSYYYTSQDKVIEYAEKVHELSFKHNYIKGIALSYNKKGVAYAQNLSFEKAFYNLNMALDIMQKISDDYETATIYNNIGSAYYLQTDITKAVEYFFKSKEYSEKSNNYRMLTTTCINIARIYINYNKFDEAYNYLNIANETITKHNIKFNLGFYYHYLGDYYRLKNMFDEALGSYNKCVDIYKNKAKDDLYYQASVSIGQILEKRGKLIEALKCYQNSLDSTIKYKLKFGIATSLEKLSNYYLNIKDYNNAINFGNRYFEKANEIRDNKEISRAALILNKAYENTGNKSEAYKYLKIFVEKSDDFSNDKVKKLNALVFDKEIKRRENELLIEKQKKEIEAKENRLKVIILLLFFLTIIIIAAIAYYRQRLKMERSKIQQINLQLSQERLKNELEFEKRETEKRETEINHIMQELSTSTLHIVNKNEILNDIKRKLEQSLEPKGNISKTIRELIKEIEFSTDMDKDWDNFKMHFEKVHVDFFKKLTSKCTQLTSVDLKLCSYLRLNLSTKEIARILSISAESVLTRKYRLKVKLGLKPSEDLLGFLCNL